MGVCGGHVSLGIFGVSLYRPMQVQHVIHKDVDEGRRSPRGGSLLLLLRRVWPLH